MPNDESSINAKSKHATINASMHDEYATAEHLYLFWFYLDLSVLCKITSGKQTPWAALNIVIFCPLGHHHMGVKQ
jgi:hypothetical protein